MIHITEKTELAQRLKELQPGEKRDAELVLTGFLHGVQAREEIKEQEAQSA